MTRREFLKSIAGAALGTLVGKMAFAGDDALQPQERLARRRFGSTGIELSIIGLGGIVVSQIEQSAANDVVAWSVDRGVNYFDVAPTYGNAEERLGPALQPYRERSFLACKSVKRDAAGVCEEMAQSLRLLHTDYFDLYQLHGVRTVEEVQQCFAAGGAMEAIVEARKAGTVRYVGFSAHSVEAALFAMQQFRFDSVLFPFNVICIENGDFGLQVLEQAQRRGVACLGLKAIAWTVVDRGHERKYPKCWYQPIDNVELADLALRYALDLPVVSTVPPGDERLYKMTVELARGYEPLAAAERAMLLEHCADVQPIFRYD